MRTVLVVDDREDVRETIAEDLEESGFRVITAGDGVEGWRCFRDVRPDAVISDLRMPREDGLGLLRRVRSVSGVPVILLTAYGDVPTAVEAMKSGATEFLTFPEELDRAVARVQSLFEAAAGPGDRELVERALPGRSVAMRRLRDRVHALVPLRVPVLVCGEPGSGRGEVVALIHRLSRGSESLVRIRPQDPAARDPWSGDLDAPVYLEDVEAHPLEAQRRWAERLRGNATRRSGRAFRFFASTALDLSELARCGRFDVDLAAELLRFRIEIPPLRERVEDLPELVAGRVAEIGQAVGRGSVRVLPAALARLRAYSWPGNERELRSVLERLVAFATDGAITRRAVDEVLGEAVESLRAFRSRRARLEREELIALLRECGGNLAEVARRMGMSRSAIHYRVHKHGLFPKARR